MKKNTDRFWEIDTLRGIAIILMVVLHILFDFNYFGIYPFKINSFPLIIFSEPARIIFLTLVGVSLYLSYSRIKDKLNNREIFIKNLKRGLLIFSGGIFLTFLSYFLFDGRIIVFGVLHCIGISIIISYPFLKMKNFNLITGFILVIIGYFLKTTYFSFDYLFILGFKSTSFYSFDYFPLMPWFGFVLLGIFFGKTLYPDFKPIINLPDLSKNKVVSFVSLLGRNSLKIYLLHQPILIIIFMFFLNFTGFS